MKISSILSFAVLGTLMSVSLACSTGNDIPGSEDNHEEANNPDSGSDSDLDSVVQIVPKDYEPIILSDEEALACSNMTDFSFKLFDAAFAQSIEQGCKTGVALSPISVAATLGMVANAVSESHQDSILSLFSLENKDISVLNNLFQTLLSQIPKIDDTSNVGLANSIWSHLENSPSVNYDANVERFYFCELIGCDICSNNFASVVNDWYDMKNNGIFPGNISFDKSIDQNAIMCFNASSFVGAWKHPFQESGTSKVDFRQLDGTTKPVDMMFNGGVVLRQGEINGMSFVSLPYGNKAFSFTAILPPLEMGFQDFIGSLNAKVWNDILSNSNIHPCVSIRLPKFEQTSRLDVDELLIEYMNFETGNALDFAEFSKSSKAPLVIKQQVYTKVDELGGGNTALTVESLSGAVFNKKYVRFNRPFVYVIHEQSTGAILIMGAVTGF